MKISDKALELIKDKDIRKKLADAKVLNCTDQTIFRYIRENDLMLTTAAALKVIREETGLSDLEILEEEPTEAKTQVG